MGLAGMHLVRRCQQQQAGEQHSGAHRKGNHQTHVNVATQLEQQPADTEADCDAKSTRRGDYSRGPALDFGPEIEICDKAE